MTSQTAEKGGRFSWSIRPRTAKETLWDAIIVGAGHNGLACAAYLARAGKKVLVLEARERVGGACTIEEVWPGVKLSPCAYLCGLLHPLVVEELQLHERGFEWTPASNGLFVPFPDGSSIQLFDDDRMCEQEVRALAPGDVEGWRAMNALLARVRDALRPEGSNDVWIGESPSPEELDRRIGSNPEARGLLFDWSMADFVSRYIRDPRLQMAYLGQGVIGTNASPFDPGTASIRFHHSSGRFEGMPAAWGYVKGGIGMVSFLMCDAALEAGAQILTDVGALEIVPGEGVVLEGGMTIAAPVIISNADPKATLARLGSFADPAWRARVEAIPMEGCTVKANVLLKELPSFRARPGLREPHHYGQLNTPLTHEEWQQAYAAARAGELPEHLWTELYFQSVSDPSVVPAGFHTMSVFAQYVPYKFARGDWDSRRDDVRDLIIRSLARYCENVPDCIEAIEISGPPDVERKVGLTGGHIFQGECLPSNMWWNRLPARTPMKGVYLCGAGTYPGGSVMAINGRNAAMAVLKDTTSGGVASA